MPSSGWSSGLWPMAIFTPAHSICWASCTSQVRRSRRTWSKPNTGYPRRRPRVTNTQVFLPSARRSSQGISLLVPRSCCQSSVPESPQRAPAALAVIRLLHSISCIFQENSLPKHSPVGMRTDRKLLPPGCPESASSSSTTHCGNDRSRYPPPAARGIGVAETCVGGRFAQGGVSFGERVPQWGERRQVSTSGCCAPSKVSAEKRRRSASATTEFLICRNSFRSDSFCSLGGASE